MTEKKPHLQQKALKTRKRVKKKKPNFARPESWRYMKLKESWRRPRGLDHKMRRKIKGWPPTVSTGYKGPKDARELHPSGYREVLVHNTKEVYYVDPKSEAARIAHTVGKRKRAEIVAEAKKRKVFILNFTPVEELIEAETEEPEATEEKTQMPTVEEKKSEIKEEKPKRKVIGDKVFKKKEKVQVKKVQKPKTAHKKTKPEKGVAKQ
jgi:large subunit ribosomal protein L32e